jgi:hypothetical protein
LETEEWQPGCGQVHGGAESEISFQVRSYIQKYNLADIASLKLDSERAASDRPRPSTSSLPSEPQPTEHAGMKISAYVVETLIEFIQQRDVSMPTRRN